MKAFFYTFLLGALMLCIPTVSVSASVVVSPDATEVTVTTKVEKKGISAWLEKKVEKQITKKIAKMQKRFAKNGGTKVDFQDPVNKWMWFWIFGWAAGLLLSIIGLAAIGGGFGVFWLLGSLFWLFGTVSLIIWLVKKFGGV